MTLRMAVRVGFGSHNKSQSAALSELLVCDTILRAGYLLFIPQHPLHIDIPLVIVLSHDNQLLGHLIIVRTLLEALAVRPVGVEASEGRSVGYVDLHLFEQRRAELELL